MKVLVTGSSGLIRFGAVEHFDRQGHEVWAWISNMRGFSSARRRHALDLEG